MCLTIPAKVISLEKDKAMVDFSGKEQKVDTQLVKVRVGDYVMVSNGFIIKKVNKKEAEEILKLLKNLKKKQWLLLLVIGLIGGSIPFLLFFKGLFLTTAAQGSFIHKTMFIYVMVFATLFFKERINKKLLFGGLFLLLGNAFLLKFIQHSLSQGDLLILLATLFWAVENIISKHVLKELPPRIVAWGRMFFGSAFILIFLVITGQVGLILNINSNQIIWVLVTSVLLFGYVMTWYSGLKHMPVSLATTILLLGAPITTLLTFISTGIISRIEILGAGLILVGVILILKLIYKIKPQEKT